MPSITFKRKLKPIAFFLKLGWVEEEQEQASENEDDEIVYYNYLISPDREIFLDEEVISRLGKEVLVEEKSYRKDMFYFKGHYLPKNLFEPNDRNLPEWF
jgi:hypothetical protein